MRFSLQDVKRQVRRREGDLTVMLHFLQAGELRAEIARLVEYYEQHLACTRGSFAQDEASSLIGDYRMASCLLATLSAWYSWTQPAWSEAIANLDTEACAALETAEIRSSVALRLALFDYVNARHAGFLAEQARPAALADFAALYHIDVAQLDYLLALDADEQARLGREALTPPDTEAVAALYNLWVFEAALFNASEVRFTIDCEAFLLARREQMLEAVTGLGAVVKRLCFLARKLGVYYDLAYEPTLPGTRTMLLHLTLYGPQEMTGNPQQYGLRLARLCRLLLGYGVASPTQTRARRQAATALNRALRSATADVHIFQHTYRFQMEEGLLALLPTSEPSGEAGSRVHDAAEVYDSGVEQSFAGAFAALERGNGVDGWQLEREPEPLLFSDNASNVHASGIFIPDFAVTRGEQRVYVEILGYWTPAYRERKVQKLRLLRGRADLILALPVEAHAAFAELAADFPLIEYHDQLSATELLRVLQTRFDDFAQRLARLDYAQIHTAIRAAGLLPERACYDLFHCYRRSELAVAASRVLLPDMAWTPGLGLYLRTWLEQVYAWLTSWIETRDTYKMPLAEVIMACQSHWPALQGCDEHTIETMLTLWPDILIQRDSIFEAWLLVAAYEEQEQEEGSAPEPLVQTAPGSPKTPRARRTGSRKSQAHETSQQHLWE